MRRKKDVATWLLLVFSMSISFESVQAARCTAGASRFVLTSISGGQHCPSIELAAAWPFISVNQGADCNYKYSGLPHIHVLPVTFAQVTYPTRSGARRPYVALQDTSGDPSSSAKGSNAYTVWIDTASGSQQEVERHRDNTLTGFVAAWAYDGLPLLIIGPFGPTTNTPGNYSAKAAGPSSFRLLSVDTGCTFTYRIVSGSFAGLKPTDCKPGSSADCPAGSSCGPGKYWQRQGATSVCALCPAGSASSDGKGSGMQSCTACKPGSAASSPGSARCQACAAPLVSSYKHPTACVPVCDKQESSDLPTYGQNVIFKGGQACTAQQCPSGTVASPNNECLAAQNGNLCVAISATGSPNCNTKADSSITKGTKTEGWGGAVLQLESADTAAAACGTGVKQLATWLNGRQTWLGFNYTQWGAQFAPQGSYPPVYGLQWQVLGSLKGSNLMPFPQCGHAHGGPGPQPMLTQGSGTVLDSTAYVFQSLLTPAPGGSTDNSERSAFRVIVEKGGRRDQITATWVRDGSIGACSRVTSIAVRRTAGGDLAAGTCRLNFKVVSGSILGAAAGSSTSCATGTFAVKHPGGATSCVACPPGYALSGAGEGCRACADNSFTDAWGSIKCVPCKEQTYGHTFCESKGN